MTQNDEALIAQGIFLPLGMYEPKYRDLARAIARIGELDCTRTLPGRLVWYSRAERDFKPGNMGEFESGVAQTEQVHCQGCHRPRYSTDHTGYCFTCRCVGVPIPLANGDSR